MMVDELNPGGYVMKLQQFEYVIAVDTYRHFATAAEKSFVTQPTLSMMIQKLEDELDLQIFDRSRHPVVPTAAGEAVIAQARVISREVRRLKEIVNEMRGELSGELSLGVIPTVAPYLLPLFLKDFLRSHPNLKLKIIELTTAQILERLKRHQIDAGILATPLNDESIREIPLYYEQFVVYASSDEALLKKKQLIPSDIDVRHVWLLEEGHCLRSQVLNLCEVHSQPLDLDNLEYEAGSIETLKKMVELHHGMAVLPELAIQDLSKAKQRNVRSFKAPVPSREISIITYQHFVKQHIVEALREAIMATIPKEMCDQKRKSIVDIEP